MKQIVEQAPIEVQYPHYISNQPKGEDLFKGKSQERLALVIAMHILDTDTTNNSVFARLIGFEGKWGSGKSNVIKLLEAELNKKGSLHILPVRRVGQSGGPKTPLQVILKNYPPCVFHCPVVQRPPAPACKQNQRKIVSKTS